MVADLVAGELDRVHARIAGRFARSEPRARAREYLSGLVAGLERKNGWTLAERAGEASLLAAVQGERRWGGCVVAGERGFVVVPVAGGWRAATVRRWLAADAIKPWQHRSWISPRAPDFAAKAAVVLDRYARIWDEAALGHGTY